MSGAVSGNDGRIPQEQIFFLSRFFLPVRRELPEPEARYAEDSFFHQTAAFRMDGVQGQILWNEGCVFFCGCLPVEQFRQSGGFIFPSSPEISKVRDMAACTTGADLIFP